MLRVKLKSLYLSVMIFITAFLAYYFIINGIFNEPVSSDNGGAVVVAFGLILIFIKFHFLAHIGFTVYSFIVFKGNFKLSSFLIKRNDKIISIFKICVYLLMAFYLFLICYYFHIGEKWSYYYGLFFISVIAVTILYTSWLMSILYEHREKYL